MAANGISEPSTIANVAARKASERVIDQDSGAERFTPTLLDFAEGQDQRDYSPFNAASAACLGLNLGAGARRSTSP